MRGTNFLKKWKDETLELWKRPISDFRPGQYERLVAHYDDLAGKYATNLYPRAEAIANVHKFSWLAYPEAERINPLDLWDLSLLSQVLGSGFVEELRRKS